MRQFILDVARDVAMDAGGSPDIDEIAAVAGVKRSHIERSFDSIDEINRALSFEGVRFGHNDNHCADEEAPR